MVYAKKSEVAHKLFDGRCYICQKKFGKWFAFHHKEYFPGRLTHKDFKNTKEYNKYVLPEVIDNPDRFRLLCKICHAKIDQPKFGYLGHMKKDKLIRLFMVAYETIPKVRGKIPPSASSQIILENKQLDAYIIDEINNLKTFLDSYAER